MPPLNPQPTSALTKFRELYRKFMSGKAWIEEGYVKRGWVYGNRTMDPSFETDIWEFENNVMRPMDYAWNLLTNEERMGF